MGRLRAVAWRTTVWLGFNLGVQTLPMLFIWSRSADGSGGIWDYVNCTLAVFISIGMLVAAISDWVTERGRVGAPFILVIALVAAMATVYLQQVFYDEIMQKQKPDRGLLYGGVLFSGCVIIVGATLKWQLWYNDEHLIR